MSEVITSGVAPYVGAWIETAHQLLRLFYARSLPTWERGLKRQQRTTVHIVLAVAPYVGAWIETWDGRCPCRARESLPTWERGLKLGRSFKSTGTEGGRSLRGSVD